MNTSIPISYRPAILRLLSLHSAVITTHINPDGDAIGSVLAVKHVLDGMGKQSTVLLPSACPDYLTWLPGSETLQVYEPQMHRQALEEADCIIVLDLNSQSRFAPLSEDLRELNKDILCIDHHEDPEAFASELLSDTSSAATCRILYDVLRPLVNGTFPTDVAQALYTGMMTDTGGFRFPRTDGALHRAIGDLIDCGADPVLTYEMLYNRSTATRMKLLGEVLAHMEFYHDGRLCIMIVPADLMHRFGAAESDVEGFVHHSLAIDGVQVGILMTERDGFVKCSFRSKGNTVVRDVAVAFGGGGHQYAAGARISGRTLLDVRDDVVSRVAGILRD